MSQLEEQLGQVLSNPQLMQQIQSLAQSLGAGQKPEEPAPPSPSLPLPDPGLLQRVSALAGNAGVDADQQALLNALGPYLSRERVSKLEKAMRAARMAVFASSFLSGRADHV